MSPNKTILITCSIYILLFIGMAVKFMNTKFTGSDPAGNGMAEGLTFLYGLAFLFVVAVIITIFNAFFYKGITHTWIKLVFFLPIGMPIFVFAHEVFEIGKSRPPSIEKQAHRLTIEIRSNEKLNNLSIQFRTSKGGSSSKLKLDKEVDGNFFYNSSHAIYFESERKFHIVADSIETEEYYLDIPYEPIIVPFSTWQELQVNSGNDINHIQFRYRIEKSS